MTDFEHYGRVFADISALIGDAGTVSIYQPKDAVLIVTTLRYPKSEQLRVDSCFNEIRRLAGDGAQTKFTMECDQSNGGKFVVRITASFRRKNNTPMKIVCTKPGYEGRIEEVDREFDNRFEKNIAVYQQPGLSIYPKADWKLFLESAP